MSLFGLIGKFCGSKRGNVAMMTALSFVPLLALLGGAVDMVRMNQMRSDIQGAIDAGVLALAEIGNDSDPDETIRQFIAANLKKSNLDPNDVYIDVTVTETLNGKKVEVDASYDMDTNFLGVMGLSDLEINLQSDGVQTYSNLEIALVLDISGSMNGTKFTNMQQAAKDFVDAVLTDEVKDRTSITLIPFSTSVNVGDDWWPLVDSTRRDNNHDTRHSDGHKWDGCVEFDSDDFNDAKPASNSMDIMPRYYATGWNPTRYCPEDNNEVLYLSNTKWDLKTKINALTVSQSTSLDIGALVGLKSLSPNMKGRLKGDMQSKYPDDYDDGTMKVLIFMTDGEATDHERPKDGCWDLEDDWVSTGHNSGYWKDCDTTRKSASDNRSDFTKVCNAAKDKGIMIYTIGFQVTEGGNSDTLLDDCASSSSQYYYVEDTDISTAFNSIAASINGVRLTY